MTKEELRNAIKVMQAYIDGKSIEWTYLTNDTEWYPVGIPIWNWDKYEYRIKQEPKYRPFKDKDECWQEMCKHAPFGWIKRNLSGSCVSITRISSTNLVIIVNDSWTFKEVFDSFTFADGTPFGVKDEG